MSSRVLIEMICDECSYVETFVYLETNQNGDPTHPHNQQSLAYQYDFYGKHGRWPTWKDAMEHCSDEMKALWIKALTEKGVEIE